MALRLYRVTSPGDTYGTVGATEKISFNASTDVSTMNGFITSYRVATTTGIGNNQAAEQDLGDHQDLGTVEEMYILNGFISKRDTASGSTNLIDIIKKWDDEIKTNTNFVHGRFGIQFDDFTQYNIDPVGTGSTQVGLIWKGIDWNPLEFDILPLRADFQIQLIVDKGDDQ